MQKFNGEIFLTNLKICITIPQIFPLKFCIFQYNVEPFRHHFASQIDRSSNSSKFYLIKYLCYTVMHIQPIMSGTIHFF